MKTRIHVNQHIIRQNAALDALGTPEKKQPPLTVKDYKQNRKAWSVHIKGDSQVIYSPNKPLSCGAKVWIETENEVVTC